MKKILLFSCISFIVFISNKVCAEDISVGMVNAIKSKVIELGDKISIAEAYDHIGIQLTTDKIVYNSSESIHMTLTVTNKSSMKLKYTYTGMIEEFYIFTRDGVFIWSKYFGAVVPTVIDTLELKPRETLTYTATWNQKDVYNNYNDDILEVYAKFSKAKSNTVIIGILP